jgi:hypothetical protein
MGAALTYKEVFDDEVVLKVPLLCDGDGNDDGGDDDDDGDGGDGGGDDDSDGDGKEVTKVPSPY